MPQRRCFVAIASLLVLLLTSPRAWSQAGRETAKDDSPTIRVGLTRSFRNAKQVTVTMSSDWGVVKTGSAEKLASYPKASPVTVRIANSHLSITPASGTAVVGGASVTIRPSDPAAAMGIESPGLRSRQYRGTIEISVHNASLSVVNVLSLEDYLPGVLVGEMPSSFPEEALKSQAVAARCYTLCSLTKHSGGGFDVCDSVHCQVFDGCGHETPKVTQAVAATKGQVLTYNGEVASVMYHSDSGGATQDYSDVYEKGGYPYMRGVTEPVGVPYSTWEKSYKRAELAGKLVAAGIKDADGLEKVTITKTSASGRALELGITGAKVSVMVSGSRLRSILGASTIKSTLFTVEASADDTVTFKGKGHGHGIGMSQVGAKALASAPFNYTYSQILDHYFPGTKLSPAPAGTAKPVPETDEKPQPAKIDSASTLGVRVWEPKLH